METAERKEETQREYLGGPVVVLCGPWVLSLVEELRFCMPQSTVKKKKGGEGDTEIGNC